MRSSVIAIVLCLSAVAAHAQCAAQASVAGSARTGPELIKTSTRGPHMRAPAEQAPAAQAPTEQAPAEQALPADDEAPTLHEAAPTAKTNDKQPRRADPAMMLAAVALMSGIALRRYSARA